jgi:hypothetical protein
MRTTVAALTLSAVFAIGCGSSPDAPSGTSGGRCVAFAKLPDPPVAMAGGQVSVAVTADPSCSWTVTSPANWISGFTPSSARGNATVLFQVAANTGPARQAEIAFNDQVVVIRQDGIDCLIGLEPPGQTIGPDITTGTINVTTASGCTWTASSNATWLLVVSGASGNGNGAVSYRAESNPGPTRTGVLTIAGIEVPITQTARPSSLRQ